MFLLVAQRSSSAYVLEEPRYDSYPQQTKVRVPQKKAKGKSTLFILMNVVFAFLLAGTILFRYANITELSRKNIALQKEYQDIQAENRMLQISINSKQDSKTVEEIAMSRLSMVKPEKYQIVYVETPKKEYAEVVGKEEQSNLIKNFMASIGRHFSEAVAYLN